MSFAYGEADAMTHQRLSAHLPECASCQQQLAQWQNAMSHLSSWNLTPPTLLRQPRRPALKWAMAALFALGLGYGIGRLATPASDLETMRAGLAEDLRSQLTRQIQAEIASAADGSSARSETIQASQPAAHLPEQSLEFLRNLEEKNQASLNTILAALKNLETRVNRHSLEQTTLRREMETVALLTEASFRQTQREMFRLAGYSDPVESFSPSQKQ